MFQTVKKACSLVAGISIALCLFTGCGNNTSKGKNNDIVVTTFPLYDWTKNIVGDVDTFSIKLLQDNGYDLHNYQPSAADIITVGKCRLFVHIGGISDEWVDGVLAQANRKPQIVNCLSLLNLCPSSHSHDHNHAPCSNHHHNDNDNDEHVWLSLRLAQKICNTIATELCKLDPANAEKYKENKNKYCKAMQSLDEDFVRFLKSSTQKTILIADQFPFIHFTEDYSLKHYAAFSGCSTESDASFKTITTLSGVLKELKLKAIFAIEGSDKKIANQIIQTSNCKETKILTLDSMQNTSSKKDNYISIMSNNIEKIKFSLQF
jgi:zinc transport system substrate-binding protein